MKSWRINTNITLDVKWKRKGIRALPVRLYSQEMLNWEPTVQLTEGLKKTITYFDKLLTRAAATHDAPNVQPSTRRPGSRNGTGRRAARSRTGW